MNDQMPMFDDPPPVEQPPRKPRKPIEKSSGERFPKHVYDLVGKLMNLELPLRNFVMEVTKALTNERPS